MRRMRVFAAFSQRRGPSAARELKMAIFFGFDCFQGFAARNISPSRERPPPDGAHLGRAPEPAPGAVPPARKHPIESLVSKPLALQSRFMTVARSLSAFAEDLLKIGFFDYLGARLGIPGPQIPNLVREAPS
jgi:hypothetical protein